MLELIIDSAHHAEERIINQVLKSVLKREINPLDWEDCEMLVKQGEPHSYFFTHKGQKLGVMTKEIKEKDLTFTLTVIFTPISDLN